MEHDLPNYCPHCGTKVVQGAGEACVGCGQLLRGRAGLLNKVISWLRGPRIASWHPVSTSVAKVYTESSEIRVQDPETGDLKVYNSFEELPTEVRQRIEALRAKTAAKVRRTYKFRDGSGVERTYRSLDEMPAEVRVIFERGGKDGLESR